MTKAISDTFIGSEDIGEALEYIRGHIGNTQNKETLNFPHTTKPL